MKSIPIVLSDELLKEANFIAHLVTFYFDTTARYTDLDIDIYYGGNQYLSRGLKFSSTEYSAGLQVDSITFEIDNVGLEFSSIILNEETRGKKCDIQKVALGSNYQVIGQSSIFKGIIDSADIDEERAAFEVYTPLILWKKKTPRRNHSPMCQWVFKGAECQYIGSETWCDQSYDRCVVLNNDINFGGFRFLPDLQTKKIWWGRTPTN